MASTIPDELAEDLTLLQRRIVDEKRQVLVIFEGRSGRVMGRVINEFMNLLEPRGITYTHFVPEKVAGPRDMLRYLSREPAKGQIAIYDRSWYSRVIAEAAEGGSTEALLRLCRNFERYLVANGVVVVKFFLNIPDETIDAVAGKMGSKRKDRGTFLTDDHIDPKKWRDRTVMPMIAETNRPHAPWDIIDVSDLYLTMNMVVRTFMDRVDHRIEHPVEVDFKPMATPFPNPRLEADLTREAKSYKSELESLSREIGDLQQRLAESGRSMVLVFEGWDAAGKGGSIKRLVRALNPRGYYVVPVAAPKGDESAHSYLWRFAINMPKAGHIVVFDRSWYGRMMVEPIEGFCTPQEYDRSAIEIRALERMITNSGGIVVKFWMEISPEEQLARFNAREANPAKSWKITDEDWRNREKWDVYEEYVDRMITATNTPEEPWVVVESEDKKYGRLKVLRTVRDILKERLDG